MGPSWSVPEALGLAEVEHLSQDRDGVPGRGLVDRERGLETEARRVHHGEEAAAHALFEEAGRDLAREGLLGLLVLHELHPEEEPTAAHRPYERVVVHERLQHLEQSRSHHPRVLGETLLVDDAEGG